MSAYGAAIEAQLRRLGPAGGAGGAGQETALGGASTTLTELRDQHGAAIRTVMGSWQGAGAGEANSRAAVLDTALTTAAANAHGMAGALRDATALVGSGRADVQSMLDDFETWAAGQVAVLRAAPEPLRPAIGAGIWAAANDTAGRAGEVVARVQAELSALAGQLRGQQDPGALDGAGAPLTEAMPAPTAPASTAPAGAGAATLAAPGTADLTGSGPSGSGPSGGGPSGGAGGGSSGGYAIGPNLGTVTPIPPGSGVQVGLPNGGSAEAPNEIAANAVRYALQQLGVPYVWGASSPGNGFDCSGLTSWAYGMAGLEIPRHSSEQAMGASVPPDQLMPGDLVVWQGHVAMVIGNGMMVEAGDPVQINPIRTSNIGMAFMGFYRPTG